MRILVINPGSTSTKIGVFDNQAKCFEQVLRHSSEELAQFNNVTAQYGFRKQTIVDALMQSGIALYELDAIACRGGACKPISGGTYLVDEQLCHDQANNPIQHPSSLAALIGFDLAKELGIKAYFTDSPMTNELSELASFSGHRDIKRHGRFHALNARAVAQTYAQQCNKHYSELNLIVCHMGGGITISLHQQGRAVDATDAIAEGPMTPERSGRLPARDLIDLCFSGQYSHDEMKKLLQGEGGVFSYLGTADMREVEAAAEEGDREARMVLDAMIYQIAKEIGAMAPVVNGQIDGVILTGGIAYSQYVTSELNKRVGYIANIAVFPGEMELEALAAGVLQVCNQKQPAKCYGDNIKVDV
ncbi:butyrate kinase [Photobacterium frigidiphilum]|uniref:Probable butyrate kinase n=1 Tax=Photobacterium frigidiphilum TaxID=264736 RepID=A0A2T3J7K9_9GAMM|nr:butyrate kinase [Photobacterium frigidiphilum]PSU44742.1 butyrate kinase [Photobacterium frigidiphilum]